MKWSVCIIASTEHVMECVCVIVSTLHVIVSGGQSSAAKATLC